MRNSGRRFDAIEAQAAAWLVRRDGGMNPQEEAEFQRWCSSDPRHAAAVAEIDAAWTVFDRPMACGQNEVLRAELRSLARRDRRRWTMVGGGATLLAAAAAVAVMFWSRPPVESNPAAANTASTARVNVPERQTLPDGSIVELNHGASITIAFNARARRVILAKGDAHFSVRSDPQKPFIVEAGTVNVRAVGTAFAVQRGHAGIEVLVTEGKVSVTAPKGSASGAGGIARTTASEEPSTSVVEVGQRTMIPLDAEASMPVKPIVLAVPEAEIKERLSWRLPRLDFSETSLAEACALFNRHNEMQLRIAEQATAMMRVTGVFRSDNIDGFVHALEFTLGIQAEHREREIVLRAGR